MPSDRDLLRARWYLLTAVVAVVGTVGGVLVFVSTHWEPSTRLQFAPARVLLAVSLGSAFLSFALYVVGRERSIHHLSNKLLEERVESEHLSAKLQYLAELTRERDTNAALIEGSADGVVVVDRDLQVVRFNRAMEHLSAVPAERAIGAPADNVLRFAGIDGVPLEGHEHPVRAVLADGGARMGAELQLRLPDGSARWVGATFSPIRDVETGHTALALVIVRDITQQKEQETAQRDFVSMAAHELRAPLTAIKGFTRTLMTKFDQLPEARRNHYLALVNEQSNRLARLVDDLSQVSRIDAHRLKLDKGLLDLGNLVRSLVEQFRSKWSDRRVEVQVKRPLPQVHADAHKIEEIVINLIDNAIKYSPSGEPVTVSIATEGGEVRLSVRDRGIGIEAKDLPSLFQKFNRLQNPVTAETPGTGLGLYIVKGLVEAHGGRVWVDSAPGEGAVFTFTLPVPEPQAEAQRVGA